MGEAPTSMALHSSLCAAPTAPSAWLCVPLCAAAELPWAVGSYSYLSRVEKAAGFAEMGRLPAPG